MSATDFRALDPAPLRKRPSFLAVVRQAPGRLIGMTAIGLVLGLIGAAIAFGAGTNWIAILSGRGPDGEELGPGQLAGVMFPAIILSFFAVLLLCAAAMVVILPLRRVVADLRMRAFADQHDLEFHGDLRGPRYDALTFRFPGTHFTHQRVVSGFRGEHRFELGDYVVEIEREKGRSHVTFRSAYLVVNLRARSPRFVLDATRNGRLRRNYPGMVRYDLEGHFPEHFTTWMRADTERDVLEILTPDLMAVFSDHARDVDIEVNGTLLVIMAKKRRITDPATMQSLFEVADAIVTALRKRALRRG